MKILNRIGRVLVVLSAVVIAAALSVNAAMNVLQRIDSAAFYERTSNLWPVARARFAKSRSRPSSTRPVRTSPASLARKSPST